MIIFNLCFVNVNTARFKLYYHLNFRILIIYLGILKSKYYAINNQNEMHCAYKRNLWRSINFEAFSIEKKIVHAYILHPSYVIWVLSGLAWNSFKCSLQQMKLYHVNNTSLLSSKASKIIPYFELFSSASFYRKSSLESSLEILEDFPCTKTDFASVSITNFEQLKIFRDFWIEFAVIMLH